MNENGLFDVVEVQELETLSKVNYLLSAGWKLLATYSYAPYVGEPQNCRLAYSVGRPSSVEPIKDPEFFRE